MEQIDNKTENTTNKKKTGWIWGIISGIVVIGIIVCLCLFTNLLGGSPENDETVQENENVETEEIIEGDEVEYLASCTCRREGRLNASITYTYNEYGQVVEEVKEQYEDFKIGNIGEDNAKVVYEYKDGLLVKQTGYKEDGAINLIRTYLYENGKLVEEKIYNGSLDYEYGIGLINSWGQVYEEQFYEDSLGIGEEDSGITYKYDTEGRMTEKWEAEFRDTTSLCTKYEYDETGFLSKRTEIFHGIEEDSVNTVVFTFSYENQIEKQRFKLLPSME